MEKDEQSKKFELLALHIEMFKKAFAGYIEYYESLNKKKSEKDSIQGKGEKPDKRSCGVANINTAGMENGINKCAHIENDELNHLLFEEIICNYYQTVISALKKLAEYDKKYLDILIKTYEELWKSAPKLKDNDYLSPYLSDLCRFLYEIKETGALTFFYNLLIYCREIPFLSLHVEQEKRLANLYMQNEEKDPFNEFRKERRERLVNDFDEGLFNKTYDKFFLILSGWNEKIEGYYAKDEISFMNGLFILDELIDHIYLEEENKNRDPDISETTCGEPDNGITGRNDKLRNGNNPDKDRNNGSRMFQKLVGPNEDRNIYRYVYDDAMKEKIFCFYEKALRNFNRAINYNPNNPRYYYEYGRCLKNSGKSNEAEIFFKKAFDLNT